MIEIGHVIGLFEERGKPSNFTLTPWEFTFRNAGFSWSDHNNLGADHLTREGGGG